MVLAGAGGPHQLSSRDVDAALALCSMGGDRRGQMAYIAGKSHPMKPTAPWSLPPKRWQS